MSSLKTLSHVVIRLRELVSREWRALQVSTAREAGRTREGGHLLKSTLERIFGRSKHQQILLRLNSVLVELELVTANQTHIMATLAELEGILEGIGTKAEDIGNKLSEGFAEVTKLIQELRDQLNTVQLPAGAQARLDALVAKVDSLQTASKAIADIVPNAPAPEA